MPVQRMLWRMVKQVNNMKTVKTISYDILPPDQTLRQKSV